MLINEEMFKLVENTCTENGIIERFEKENGKILGRMMITKAEIPQKIQNDINDLKHVHAFCASFDFYNTVLGVAVRLPKKEIISDLWIISQDGEQDDIDEAWIDFFLQTLIENIEDDGKLLTLNFNYEIWCLLCF